MILQKKLSKKKTELRELTNRFKELKSLIYDYRDEKEQEIKGLNENHHQIKNEIETNKKNYEKIIDDTANEISNFVDKVNLENFTK